MHERKNSPSTFFNESSYYFHILDIRFFKIFNALFLINKTKSDILLKADIISMIVYTILVKMQYFEKKTTTRHLHITTYTHTLTYTLTYTLAKLVALHGLSLVYVK